MRQREHHDVVAVEGLRRGVLQGRGRQAATGAGGARPALSPTRRVCGERAKLDVRVRAEYAQHLAAHVPGRASNSDGDSHVHNHTLALHILTTSVARSHVRSLDAGTMAPMQNFRMRVMREADLPAGARTQRRRRPCDQSVDAKTNSPRCSRCATCGSSPPIAIISCSRSC